MSTQLIIIFAGALVAIAILCFTLFGTGAAERRRAERLNSVRRRVSGEALPKADGEAGDVNLRRDKGVSRFQSLDAFVSGLVPDLTEFKQLLRRTGRNIEFGSYLVACAAVAVVTAALVFFAFSQPPLMALLIGLGCGAGVPYVVVRRMADSRAAKFNEIFPDAIDLIVRGLKSGLPVTESIGSVGREMPDPVGVEFRTVFDEMAFGKTLEEALWDAAGRLGTAEFKFFVISLAVQQETGGNLSETLGNLSDILRRRRQMKLKIRAMSSEARASAMILGSLPFIMFGILSMLNWNYISPLLSDPRGHTMLIGAGISLLLGVLVMAKMVRFEI